MTPRSGPVLIEYRDRGWNGWPCRASLSCFGCMHLSVGQYGEGFCAHPKMLEKYEVPQHIGGGWRDNWKLLVNAWQCPEAFEFEQPPENRMSEKHPWYWPHHHDLHCVRHAVTWTSGWGTSVLEDALVKIRNGYDVDDCEAGGGAA